MCVCKSKQLIDIMVEICSFSCLTAPLLRVCVCTLNFNGGKYVRSTKFGSSQSGMYSGIQLKLFDEEELPRSFFKHFGSDRGSGSDACTNLDPLFSRLCTQFNILHHCLYLANCGCLIRQRVSMGCRRFTSFYCITLKCTPTCHCRLQEMPLVRWLSCDDTNIAQSFHQMTKKFLTTDSTGSFTGVGKFHFSVLLPVKRI